MIIRPAPKWLRRIVEPILITFGAIIMSPLIAMLWIADAWNRRFGPGKDAWQRVFAWAPTQLGWEPDGETVWLEMVERIDVGYRQILYRRPGDTSVKTPQEMGED